MNKIISKSLTRQFGWMASVAIILFSAVIAVYVFWQNNITSEFKERNHQLDLKENATIALDDSYNKAISEFRAYFAYGQNGKNKLYYERGIEQKETVIEAYENLKALAENDYDKAFLQQVNSFYQLYFLDLVPKTVAAYERGNTSEVAKTAVEGGSEKVRVFQTALQDYSSQIEREINENRETFTRSLFVSQMVFLAVLVLLIGTLIALIRRYLRKMQKPLQTLTVAAGEIAAGNDVVFDSVSSRKDELGLLHVAFSKMSKSIAEKEQDLTAQNEELIAQQDELQAQQDELRTALENMWERESQLKLRNELSNGISNTLNKQKLLNSIITTMCRIAKADTGIIMMTDQPEYYAAVSLSESAIGKIRTNMDSGLIQEVKRTNKYKVYKRLAHAEETGYHETAQYSYDLYLPVLSSGSPTEAIIIFTRFNEGFDEKEIAEYASMSKNIALSLDKLKLYEQAEQDKEMVRHILNTIHEGIQLVDLKGSSLQVNTTMKSMLLMCSEEDLAFASFEEWFTHFSSSVTDPKPLENFLRSVIFSQEPVHDSFTYKIENGTVVNLYSEPLYRNGKRLGTVMVHRDITKEYEVDQMKSEFVSTVSHELRTPLASVLGFTELLLFKDLKPERRKKYLTTIYQEGKRLTSLINNFLDVQKMEAGKKTYEKRLEDLSAILGEVVEEQQILTSEHRFFFHTSARNSMILGDRDMLKQVFQNLTGNAVKYSPNGGSISVILYEQDQCLKVDIKDEGLGIPEDAADKLFTKFYRVDNSDRRKIGGTGLGLAIVKEILKSHNGDITVQSKLGQGSTFTVSLPLPLSGNSDASASVDKDHSASANILIIENDTSFASLLKAEFEEMGLSSAVMLRGDRALSEAAELKPDAVVLDILLSEDDLNGWDVLKQLKQVPHLAKIPVFISTALNEKEKAVSLGTAGYLTKPYQPGELIKLVIKTILDRKSSLSEMEP